jgi:hypothetical protein
VMPLGETETLATCQASPEVAFLVRPTTRTVGDLQSDGEFGRRSADVLMVAIVIAVTASAAALLVT